MQKKVKKGKKVGLWLVLIIIVLLAGIFALYENLTAPVDITSLATIEIASGSSTTGIANQLADAGLIKNAQIFRLIVSQKGSDGKFQAGTYEFEAGKISMDDIITKLTSGDTKIETVKVTIPEGLKVINIANIFAEKGLADVDVFMEYALNGDFPYDYLPPAGSEYRLEGFLFPETYMIDLRWNEEDIIDMMLAQFDTVYTAEYRARAAELGFTDVQLIALASIIEKEGKHDEDRPLIASVIYNRLHLEMLLQCDATIQFLFETPKYPLLKSDLQIDSPYNSYKYAGLPPGPIAAPGKASILAALYPYDSDYLYFVADEDGVNHYGRNLTEHEENIKKYL